MDMEDFPGGWDLARILIGKISLSREGRMDLGRMGPQDEETMGRKAAGESW